MKTVYIVKTDNGYDTYNRIKEIPKGSTYYVVFKNSLTNDGSMPPYVAVSTK